MPAPVALSKPTETERGEWYFQRYVEHLPSAGNMVVLDRSWYNWAGVERVLGFCTEAESVKFLDIMGPDQIGGVQHRTGGHLSLHPFRRCAVDGRAGERQATNDPQRHALRADAYRLYRQGFFCRRATRPIDCRLGPRILCNAIERSSKLVVPSLKARTGVHCRIRRTTSRPTAFISEP